MSVGSVGSDGEKKVHHRRGSSLVDQHQLAADMKEQPKNRSSPDIDLVGAEGVNQEVLASMEGEGEEEVELPDDGVERSKSSVHRMSDSTISRVSIRSTITLKEAGEAGQEEGEGQEEEATTPLQKTPLSFSESTREERAGTIHSDMSGSCSTLQNDRTEGEIESSLEQVRKQQMSVLFRRELLSVSQVKTDSRIGLEVAKMAEPNFDLVQLLGRSLPHVVPNVALSKREVGVTL